jgi:hypothetical protein
MTSDPKDEGVQEAAEQAEAELDDLQHHSDEVGEGIEQTRQDWERRQQDSNVPGAQAPADDDTGEGHPTAGEPDQEETPEKEAAGDWEGEGKAADEAGQ